MTDAPDTRRDGRSVDELRAIFSLSGKRAVVIGAGSGIGRAAAEGLGAHGAEVVCADVNEGAARSTQGVLAAAGVVSTAAHVDVGDAQSVANLVSSGPLPDVLVTTPSINVRKTLETMSDEEFDRVVAINLKGTFRVLRDFGREMAARGSGSMIVLSSIRSLTIEPGQGVYAATKSGVIQLMRTFAAELGPRGVRVNAVAPGVVDTPLTRPIRDQPEWYDAYARKTILGRWARPDEMAGAIVFLASDASSYVTGAVLFIDGGWTAADGRYLPPL